ncbi:hypothetical protein FSP39_014539 [Pinctada imbricata]|uniref:Uncharacterized protein n=1 Tax=Pinctada imbricata TaxID=66713 RepID=A0AA88XHT7_PINIB|nr:hypothetical protein FSP39_014539 [Pinctada imbricata]
MRTAKLSRSPAKTLLSKRFSLLDNERKFKKACEQILQLNHKMDDMQFRYTKPASHHRSFRYNLRLRLAVIEGLRNMYYDYAHHKAEAVADLRRELFGEAVEIISEKCLTRDGRLSFKTPKRRFSEPHIFLEK